MRLGVVILAAGGSRRMGRPKLLLPWGGGTVVEHLVKEWRALGAEQISAVVSTELPELDHVLAELEVETIVNADPERGMFSSIQSAAHWSGWNDELTHVVVTLGDQPHLCRSTLEALVAFGGDNPEAICQPALAGRAKHPVLFPRSPFREIGDDEGPTLAHFLSAREGSRKMVAVDDPGLALDLDTPGDYGRALMLLCRQEDDLI